MKPKEPDAVLSTKQNMLVITINHIHLNTEDIKQITRKENARGENIKAVIISKQVLRVLILRDIGSTYSGTMVQHESH